MVIIEMPLISINQDATRICSITVQFSRSSLKYVNTFYIDLIFNFSSFIYTSFVIQILDEYNESGSKLSMVLFEDALEHLTRVHRSLRMHRGHVLVVGSGGSGKQSVIRLASFAAELELFEIQLSRGYDEASFREDIKKLYDIAGTQGKRVVFLFTDSQAVDDSFLELVNTMLSTGVIPTLYAEEEKDEIVNACREASKDAGYGVTKYKFK